MNKNRRQTINTNQNIVIEFTNERIIPAGGLAVVGALLGKCDFIKKINRMDVTPNRSQHQIKNGDILLTYIGMLCMGKPYFEAVHEMDDDKDFYKAALGITRAIPSEETLRQRMDDIGDSLRDSILQENVSLLQANKIQPSLHQYWSVFVICALFMHTKRKCLPQKKVWNDLIMSLSLTQICKLKTTTL